MKMCLYCDEKLEGRTDKVFCNPSCKSAHHYKLSQDKEANLYNRIDNQLKLNRRILKNFNKSGKATVRKTQKMRSICFAMNSALSKEKRIIVSNMF